MARKINTLLFYKFVKIENSEELAKNHLAECNKLGLLGRILVSREGINGSVCGNKTKTNLYKRLLKDDKRFSDIRFKEETGTSETFTKMAVKVKETIINFGREVDISLAAPYISPEEFVNICNIEKDIIVLDARNNYEWAVGKLKNATTLPIKTFRQFPEAVMRELGDKKDKLIVTYCTGGIRCEKASAFMRENGFTNVYQLKDGILNFCKEFPDSNWEGKCFVFDKRLLSEMKIENNSKIFCEICSDECNLYRNCHNFSCDRFVVLCPECDKSMNGCCSEKCFGEFREHCRKKALRKQGRRVRLNTS